MTYSRSPSKKPRSSKPDMETDYDKFCNELDALIKRWRSESDLNYAEVIAALEFRKFTLMMEARGES